MPADVIVKTKINASVLTVWKVISDFSTWQRWHKSDVHLEMDNNTPKYLHTHMSGMKLKIQLKEYRTVENNSLEWVGSLPFLHFLLSGHRRFVICPDDDGGCVLSQEETFFGLVGLFFKRKLIKDYLKRYKSHNLAIKQIAESS